MLQRTTEREELQSRRCEDCSLKALVAGSQSHRRCEIHAEESQHESWDIDLEPLACAAASGGDEGEILEDTILKGFVREDIDDSDDPARDLLDLSRNNRELLEIISS